MGVGLRVDNHKECGAEVQVASLDLRLFSAGSFAFGAALKRVVGRKLRRSCRPSSE